MEPTMLISPEGRECIVTTESQYHDLVEGRGYRPQNQSTPPAPPAAPTRTSRKRETPSSAHNAAQSQPAESTEDSAG